MKKYFLSLIVPLVSFCSFGQVDFLTHSSSTEFCEHEQNPEAGVPIIVTSIEGKTWADFFGADYLIQSGDDMIPNPHLRTKWEIEYPTWCGTYVFDDNPTYHTLQEQEYDISRRAYITASPALWINPCSMTVTLRGYVYNPNDDTYTEVDEAWDEVNFTPRKTFSWHPDYWPGLIDQEDTYEFAVTYVPGVTYDWTFPQGWSQSGNGALTTATATVGSQSGGVQVTTTPELNACNYPFSKYIQVDPCFQNGTTDFDFVAEGTWLFNDLNTQNYGDKIKFPRYVADFNGDGKDDIIGFGNDYVRVGLSNGSGFVASNWSDQFTYNSPGSWSQDQRPRYLGDFNGDGKMDVVGFNNSATYVMLSTGTSFTGAAQWNSGFDNDAGYDNRTATSRHIGDFNGDGTDDVLGIGYYFTEMGLSNGSSAFVNTSFTGAEGFTAHLGGFNDPNKYPIFVGDFDGNGIDDLIGFKENTIIVGLSDGSAFSTTVWATNMAGVHQWEYWQSGQWHIATFQQNGTAAGYSGRLIGDFNGDGMDDFVNGVAGVKLSTGSSFTNGFGLPDGMGQSEVNLDMRELGVVPNGDFAGEHELAVVDMNADGKADIVFFGEDETRINYSTGNGFQCKSSAPVFHNGLGYHALNYLRAAGNFDGTDDELELIGFGFHNISVINPNNCPNTVAQAEIDSELYITQESGYNGWTVSMNHLCLDGDVILDLEGTSCEDSYQYTISSFDLNTWSSTNLVSTGWIYGKAPATLDITNEVNWVVGQVYKVQFAVGPTWSAKELFFVFDGQNLIANMSLQGTQVVHYGSSEGPGGALPIEVTNVCDYNGQVKLYPESSTCYSHYRIEVNPIDHGTFQPNGPAVYTYPAASGFATGIIGSYHNVSLSNCLVNQIYRVRLYVSDDGGNTFSYTERYVRRVTCNGGGRKGPAEHDLDDFEVISPFSVNVHPNPTNGIVFASISGIDIESNTSVDVYNSVGQLVRSIVVSQSDFKVDLSDLADGIYIFNIQNNTNSKMIRVIKK